MNRRSYRIGFYNASISGQYGEYTSKAKAHKAAVAMAKGNCYRGMTIYWYVEDLDGNTVDRGAVKWGQ